MLRLRATDISARRSNCSFHPRPQNPFDPRLRDSARSPPSSTEAQPTPKILEMASGRVPIDQTLSGASSLRDPTSPLREPALGSAVTGKALHWKRGIRLNDHRTPSSCCTPSAQREAAEVLASPSVTAAATTPGRPMVTLPGGTFLMGTDYKQGFPADGEGPVRPVLLSPFSIDTYPVTNADFAAFVAATNFRTEAEA